MAGIARAVNLPDRTVRSIARSYCLRGTIEAKKPPGRPRILDEKSICQMIETLSIAPFLTVQELQRKLDINGAQPSRSTVYRALRDNGMAYKFVTKIPIKHNERTKHVRSVIIQD